MPEILDYAPAYPTPLLHRLRTAALLLLGFLAYALLCQPAIHQRGYPPIDHLWTAMTYLWLFPVPLFVSISPRPARYPLLAYALATAYVDAATVIMMVPHRFTWTGTLDVCILTVPVHIIAVAAIAWLTRRFLPSRRSTHLAIALLAVLFPFAYRQSARAVEDHHGRQLADADWSAHAVQLYSDDFDATHQPNPPDGIRIVSNIDPATGFPHRRIWYRGFERGYSARITQLVHQHGIPPWSLQSRLIPDATLLSLLTASNLQPLTTFPTFITPDVAVMRAGSFSAWGTSYGSNSTSLSLLPRHSDPPRLGEPPPGDDDTAFVTRLPQYPRVLFIRAGHHGIAACTDDGWILSYAIKD
ncbi:MAG TPA: hypothetical protein VFE58_16335 [Tepidisphaeraceae bacterium]|nr:hypothetical protein [Tepidisphaeraceae bacterium]